MGASGALKNRGIRALTLMARVIGRFVVVPVSVRVRVRIGGRMRRSRVIVAFEAGQVGRRQNEAPEQAQRQGGGCTTAHGAHARHANRVG